MLNLDRVCAIYVVKIYHNFNTADELYLPKSSQGNFPNDGMLGG